MADTNIAPIYGSIHSYSSQGSGTPAANVIDGITTCVKSWTTLSNANEWVIIDLGASYSITGFKIYGYACTIDASKGAKAYRVGLSNTGTDEENFTQVVSNNCGRSTILGGKLLYLGSHESVISPTTARYVKLYMDTNWGAANYIYCADFEIHSPAISQDQADVASDAEIYSSAPTLTALSNARIYVQTVSKIKSAISNATLMYGAQITSDAFVVPLLVKSNAHLIGHETATILSNAYVYQSGSISRNTFISGQGTLMSGSRGLLVYTTDMSTSDETIVVDMITSGDTLNTVLDLETISPPLGYKNYDWVYDWVVRTYNDCQYKFETRSGNTLTEMKTAVFHRITQGQLLPRGSVDRFHQWRAHVWASGSGDFELHQFTIKGYVNYPQDPFYRALCDQEFCSTTSIVLNSEQNEPEEFKLYIGEYLPGDVNGDGIVNINDVTYLMAYISGSGPAPVNIQAADVNQDGSVNALDVAYLVNYLNGGTPPILRRNVT